MGLMERSNYVWKSKSVGAGLVYGCMPALSVIKAPLQLQLWPVTLYKVLYAFASNMAVVTIEGRLLHAMANGWRQLDGDISFVTSAASKQSINHGHRRGAFAVAVSGARGTACATNRNSFLIVSRSLEGRTDGRAGVTVTRWRRRSIAPGPARPTGRRSSASGPSLGIVEGNSINNGSELTTRRCGRHERNSAVAKERHCLGMFIHHKW